MGILDFLRGTSGPTPAQIGRAVKQVTQPHGDAAIRLGAADRLRDWATPESIAGLLRRFTVQTPSGQVDLEECQHVQQMLVDLGERAVEPLVSFLRKESGVAYPAGALRKILGTTKFTERMLGILDGLDAGFGSTGAQRQGLLRALDDIDDPRIAAVARQFLGDPSDDVAIAAMDCVLRADDPDYLPDFVELFVATGDRPRIRLEVTERLAEKGWPLKEMRKQLEGALPPGFALDKKGRVTAV